MTKSLTEKWKDVELDGGYYYLLMKDETLRIDHTKYKFWNKTICWEHIDEHFVKEVLAPVPSYESLYNPNDGTIPTGLFTVLKIIKRDIERTQEYRDLTGLECGIKSQVVSLLKSGV